MSLLEGVFSDAVIFLGIPLGLWVSFRVLRYPDLSIEQLFVLGGALFGSLSLQGWSLLEVFCALLAVAVIQGLIASFFRTRVGVHPIILSLSLSYAYYSVSLTIMGGPSQFFGGSVVEPMFGRVALWALFLNAILILLLAGARRTRTGLQIIALGSNRQLATRLGWKIFLLETLGLAASFFCVMASGLLFVWRAGNIDISYGGGLLLVAIFVVVLTATVFRRPKVLPAAVALAGALALYLGLLQSSLRVGLPPHWMRGITGLSLLAAISLLAAFGRRSPDFQLLGGNGND